MVDVLRIRDWEEHFEHRDHKRKGPKAVKVMWWVSMPTKHDGEGYLALLDHEDGLLHFGAWVLMVQVAAKCEPRGTLLRDGRLPHTPRSLARKTNAPEAAFEAAIPRLLSEEIGWLEVVPLSLVCSSIAGNPRDTRGVPVAQTDRQTGQTDSTRDRGISAGNGRWPGSSHEWDQCLAIMTALEFDEEAREQVRESRVDDLALYALLKDVQTSRRIKNRVAYTLKALRGMERDDA